MSAEPSPDPGDGPAWLPLPDDLASLSEEEIARLAAGIWEALVGLPPDEAEADEA